MDFAFDIGKRLITVTCPDRIVFEDVIATMNAIYDAPDYDGPYAEFWDLSATREIKLAATYRGLLPAFQAAEAKIKGSPRCALLCPTTMIFGMAKMYEMLWTTTPLRLKAFLDRAKAERWVAE